MKTLDVSPNDGNYVGTNTKKWSPKEYTLRNNETCETSDCGTLQGQNNNNTNKDKPSFWSHVFGSLYTKLIQIDLYDSNFFTNTPKRI